MVSAGAIAEGLRWRNMRQWRWPGVLSRTIAAILGGYGLASLAAICMALFLPMTRADAVVTGMLASFAIYAGAVIWVFAASSAWRAWLGLLVPLIAMAAAAWLATRGISA
ncbi:DUF3649 domain-containing protein [Roseococcus sp. YIM B11640]|uniref:DUF3649 domain-containing protein n=1 Tax=Roseococcus sp. YIM B11640 TaxID=3133973 RepID=UPI003C7DEF52